jgi:expansin
MKRTLAGSSWAAEWHKWGWYLAIMLVMLARWPSPPLRAQAPRGQTVWLPIVVTAASAANPIHQGIATYYGATGAGACLFDPSPADLMVAAMNAAEYNTAAVCGAYVRVTGPSGVVVVRIVDLCPECQAGHLDLSQEAFAQIADPVLGRVPISWQVISPELTDPISYHFKDGSNQWWTAVQIRNHRNPIASLEYHNGSAWVTVARTDYNYFVQTNPGMGPGPYQFRVTDSYGNVLVDSSIAHVENGTVVGSTQFPAGP